MTPARTPALSRQGATVDVWRLRVGDQLARWDRHWACLNDEERSRALAYRRDADRQRFVVARAGLRELLGQRLGRAPQDITLAANAYGKPALVPPHALHFNVSHAGDWVLIALSADAPVGVDVEELPREPRTVEQLKDALAPRELVRLRLLPEPARGRALLSLWVAKEAYVKARGEGLSRRLRDIAVDAQGEGFALRHDLNDREPASDWSLRPLDVDERHVACLACARATVDVRLHEIAG